MVTSPIELDVMTKKRLTLIKRVYRHACSRHAPLAPFSRLLTVMELDWVAESTLHAMIRSIDPSVKQPERFPHLVSKCDELLQSKTACRLPKANILYVHKIRNDAQHAGRFPSESETSECREFVTSFITEACMTLWSIDFLSLSLGDLIQNDELRGYILAADSSLAQHDIREAVSNAAASLTRALDLVNKHLGLQVQTPSSDLDQGVREIIDAIQKTQQLTVHMGLGLNLVDYIRYLAVAPAVMFTAGGDAHIQWWHSPEETSDEVAEWVVGFCAETVIEIESRLGSFGDGR